MFQQFLRRIAAFIQDPALARSRVPRVLLVLVAFGYLSAAGFHHFEHEAWSEEGLTLVDSAWWCFTTMTTVGYGDYYPRTLAGRWLVGAPTMLVGIGTMGYLITVVASQLIERRGEREFDTEPPAAAPAPEADGTPSEGELIERWRTLRGDGQTRVLDLTRRLSAHEVSGRERS